MTIRLTIVATLCLALGSVQVFAAERLDGPVTEEAEIAGAAFRIDIPENWNGGLVMYAHGYAVAGSTPTFNMGMVQVANEMGFAVAQSKYVRQGWAAREGILDTETLRRYFVDNYGETYPTIIAGHSQGAAITYATIEKYPEVYDGAMPMCGAGTSALEFMKTRVFDLRLLFDYYFPGLPGSVVEFPEGKETMAVVSRKADELLKDNPEKAERFVRMVNISSVEAAPGVIAFWSEILRELQERTGGNAFGNHDTIYSGSDDDITLNRKIPRYSADPKSVEYMRRWVSLTANISDPVLALHTMVDDLIPPPQANAYQLKAALQGTSELYVQHYVDNSGHCNFTAAETREALTQLVAWVKDGKRPKAANLTRR